MFSFVRIILLALFASSVVMGGLGVQQGDSSFLKGGAGLLVIAFLLVVIYKIIWKAMGCLVVVGILLIGGFMMFSGSGFMPDFGSVKEMMSPMDSEKKVDAQKIEKKELEKKDKKTSALPFINLLPEEKHEEKPSIMPSMGGNFKEKPIAPPPVPNQEYIPQNMMNAPPPQNTVSGTARVINGDTIQINNRIVRLFGVDAPEPSQTCADSSGSSYRCGQRAAQELRKMLGNSEVVCNIMQQNSRGHAIGTCSVGPYDIGAAMVSNGWALAYRQYSGEVYVPYENSARSQQAGLWDGEFYTPWDWRDQNTVQKKSVLDSAIINQGTGNRSSSSSNIGQGIVGNLLKMF